MSYYDYFGNRGNQVAIIWITVTLNRMQSSILFRSFFLGSKIGLGRLVKILGAGCWWRPGRSSSAGNLPAPPTVPGLPSGADFHAFNTPFFYWFLRLQRKTQGKLRRGKLKRAVLKLKPCMLHRSTPFKSLSDGSLSGIVSSAWKSLLTFFYFPYPCSLFHMQLTYYLISGDACCDMKWHDMTWHPIVFYSYFYQNIYHGILWFISLHMIYVYLYMSTSLTQLKCYKGTLHINFIFLSFTTSFVTK